MYLLLVTWLTLGTSPSSYQVQFDTAAACNAARDAIINDRARLLGESFLHDQGLMRKGVRMATYTPVPTVSVVCAAKRL